MSETTQSPRSVIEAYVTGTAQRDIALLEEIFHEDAVMSGWLGQDLLHGGPEPFYGALEANEISEAYAADITHVTQTGPVATATLTEANLLGLSFTNHFHLAQQEDGSWRITSKLFSHS